MITFPISLLQNENSASIPKLKNLYVTLVNKVSQSIKESGMSIALLNKFMPILGGSMNQLDYGSHMEALRRATKGKTAEMLRSSSIMTE